MYRLLNYWSKSTLMSTSCLGSLVISNVLSINILSEIVHLGKSLISP